MYSELISANPTDFTGDHSTFEKLVRMQHYSLPTRLLDITSNPLMALYFCCVADLDEAGEVITFSINEDEIKFSDSDTVSLLANLSRLELLDKDELDRLIDMPIMLGLFNRQEPVTRLLHFVGQEKPYFRDRIDRTDLRRVLCVRPKMNNDRVIAQSGAFLIFGHNATLPEIGAAEIEIQRVSIDKSAKEKILQELDKININSWSVFPYIENSAKYIRHKHDH